MPELTNRDGLRLFFHDWGSGPPLVFLHGGALDADCWEYQMVPLSERGFRCVAADTRGCGRSEQPGCGYSYDHLARDLDDLLVHLDLRDVVLVAHSMAAGTVLRHLSSTGAGRIGGVVLVAPTTPYLLQGEDNPQGVPRAVFDESVALLRRNRPAWIELAAPAFFGSGAGADGDAGGPDPLVEWGKGLARSSGAKATIELFRSFFETDFRSELSAVTVPALVVHGDADLTAPLDLTGRLTAAGIPGARLEVYGGASHGLFLTHADRLAEDIAAFAVAATGAVGVP